MIGHTIPAAGVAGLIKTALALHHRVLPPTLGVRASPTRSSGSSARPFYINTETRPWIHGGSEPRRAGVNAFGFGGHQRPRRARGVRAAGREAAGRTAAAGTARCASSRRSRRRRWPSAAGELARERLAAERPELDARRPRAARSAASSARERPSRGAWRSSRLARRPAQEARPGGREAARPRLRTDQDDVAASTTRPSRSAATAKVVFVFPGRGRPVPEHARRPVPAVPRGARGVRPHRPALRRSPARPPAQRLGVPAARVLRRGAPRAPRRG